MKQIMRKKFKDKYIQPDLTEPLTIVRLKFELNKKSFAAFPLSPDKVPFGFGKCQVSEVNYWSEYDVTCPVVGFGETPQKACTDLLMRKDKRKKALS